MSHQIIRQPDGLLCVWSTVVDDFIVVDATPKELIESYARIAEEKARADTQRIIDIVLGGSAKKVYYYSAMTYDEAMALRQWRHDGSPHL